MSITRSRRAKVALAISTMVVAACLTTSPIPSYADPPCDWVFDGQFQLDQQTGHVVTFDLHGKQFPPGGVRATYAGQGGHGYGSARGGTRESANNGIVGQNIFFTIW